jgi:3-dehydroquinate dehydratase type I
MKICTPVQERTQKEVMERLKKLKGKADLAEVWLDHIHDLDVKNLIKKSPVPLFCVCRKKDEKGMFRGSDKELSEILTTVLEYGAAYVDIPYGMPKNLSTKITQSKCQRAKNPKCQIIISHHDFEKTPPTETMLKMARDMKKRGADIVKISVMAKSYEDTLSVIFLAQILQSENIPHILIAMGKKGILTRVITPLLGGTIMFAPLTKNQSSASGQMTVGELKKAWGIVGK